MNPAKYSDDEGNGDPYAQIDRSTEIEPAIARPVSATTARTGIDRRCQLQRDERSVVREPA